MQAGMYSGLFGALTTEHRMNFIANNLANVNTRGYKRDTLAFKDTMVTYAHDEIREPILNLRSKPLFPEPHNAARARIAVARTDFSQGSMQFTGNALDVAINGENAFFRVTTPNGAFLTRNGAFSLNADGVLMTPQGYTVQGLGGGNIVIPPGTFRSAATGKCWPTARWWTSWPWSMWTTCRIWKNRATTSTDPGRMCRWPKATPTWTARVWNRGLPRRPTWRWFRKWST